MTGVPSQRDNSTFPTRGNDEQRLRFVLRYAVQAPSGHNTQPWLFSLDDGALLVRADRSRGLPVVDPDDRALTISCGAAIGFAVAALRHFGYAGAVELLPRPYDPDLLATVRLGPTRTPEPTDDQLFDAIGRRHTHRAAFDERSIPNSVLARLAAVSHRPSVTLDVITRVDVKTSIASLVSTGDKAQFGDDDFRRELAAWVRHNRTRRLDGMPGYAFGISDLPSLLGPTMIATFDTGPKQARKDALSARTAPALLLLSTPGDNPADWLRTGQALATLLLQVTADGLCASFLNQPIEEPTLRGRLRDQISHGRSPQLLLRVGYPTADHTVRRTPRRPVADVLTPARTSTGGVS